MTPMTDDSPDPSFEGDQPAAAEQRALPDRRELALVAVERTRMPMVVTDPRQPDNPIVLANSAFLTLTGYRADEVVGRNCRFLQGPDTDPVAVDTLRRGLARGEDHLSAELLNYRKDGSVFWNELAISRVSDENNELLYYFASQRDTTARRRIEQMEAMERHLLMEVDHRAMNALALVQSIVRLTRADSVSAYAASILGRVDALARAHRLLARSGWLGADLGQLLASEIPEGEEARISVAGAQSQLAAPLVQPLALVLHELMSNARLHGALAQAGGTLSVGWTQQPGSLTLDWREHGVALEREPPEPGFGLRTLVGVIRQQLRGELTTAWTSPGFSARISVPVPEPAAGGAP